MNFAELKIVSKCLPDIGKSAILPTAPVRGEEGAECPFDEASVARFIRCYNDFGFGWKAATQLAKYDCVLPIFPRGSDKWFYRAWLLMKDPKANEDVEAYDPIREAWIIDHRPEQRPTKELLRALLITTGATTERVADILHIAHDVVEAYECLFFNVIARKDDATYIRNYVYPDTKMEEMLPGYFEKANLGRILLRIGYNYTTDDILHFAGMRLLSYKEGITQAQALEDYQHKTMANGLILANTGFLNYASPIAGLVAAKNLATSINIGGKDGGAGADDGLGDFVGSARVVLDKNKKIIEGSIAPVYR